MDAEKVEVKDWGDIKKDYENGTVVLGYDAYKYLEGVEKGFSSDDILGRLKNRMLKASKYLKMRDWKVTGVPLDDECFTQMMYEDVGLFLEDLLVSKRFLGKMGEKDLSKALEYTLSRFIRDITPIDTMYILGKMGDENSSVGKYFEFLSSNFKYVCPVSLPWIPYLMFIVAKEVSKYGERYKCNWADFFYEERLKGEIARNNALGGKDHVILYPYGSPILVQSRHSQSVLRIEATKRKYLHRCIEEKILQFSEKGYIPFFITGVQGRIDKHNSFFASNEYLDYIYRIAIPDYLGKTPLVLYGFQNILPDEYLLRSLFKHVEQVAVSIDEAKANGVDKIHKTLKEIERNCGRISDKAITFEFFYSDSILK